MPQMMNGMFCLEPADSDEAAGFDLDCVFMSSQRDSTRGCALVGIGNKWFTQMTGLSKY